MYSYIFIYSYHCALTALLGTLYICMLLWLQFNNCHTLHQMHVGGWSQVEVLGFRWKWHLLHWKVECHC